MNDVSTERLCEVATTDESGKRHAVQLTASSTYRAACYYFSKACYDVSAGLPRPNNDTEYEVRIIGEERVYRVNHRRMMEWAQREAERQKSTSG